MSRKEKIERLEDELIQLNNEAAKIYQAGMPKFERGMVEAAMERAAIYMADLNEVCNKHNIHPAYAVSMQSENQQTPDGLPLLVFGGIMVELKARVFPQDKDGKEGVSDGTGKKLMQLEAEMNSIKAKIQKLGGNAK